MFTVYLLEGNIKCWHDSCSLFAVSHHVVFVVEELQIDHVVDLLSEVISQVVELVEGTGVILKFMVLYFGRNEVDIVPSLVVVDSR